MDKCCCAAGKRLGVLNALLDLREVNSSCSALYASEIYATTKVFAWSSGRRVNNMTAAALCLLLVCHKTLAHSTTKKQSRAAAFIAPARVATRTGPLIDQKAPPLPSPSTAPT